MLNTIKRLSILVSVFGLTACGTFNPNGYINFQSYNDHGTELYPEGYENAGGDADVHPSKAVKVPPSYHVSAYHTPTSSKNVDEQWVNSQNASGFTIEVADSDKATTVANILLKAPKSERSAQIKLQHGTQTVYKGVYGSFPNQEAAQQALEKLPAYLKQNATITSWGNVQADTNR